MGKDKGSKKDKGTKLGKAERAALKEREAELELALEVAKLAEAKRKQLKAIIADKDNPKALRKAAKVELVKRGDGSQKQALEADAPAPKTKAEREALKPKPEPTDEVDAKPSPARVVAAADKVLADRNASEGARTSATKAKAKALSEMSDDELKDRVSAKREAREALAAAADDVDRDDVDAVRAYNEQVAALGGGKLLTSTAERDKAVASLKEDKPKRKAKPDEIVVEIDGETLAEPAQVVESVETEEGTVYEAGAAKPDAPEEFAKPSEAPRDDFDVNGNGQYKIQPVDGKPGVLKGYTRVTTYIDNLESKTQLETWKLRLLLEGVAITEHPENATSGGVPEPVSARMRQLIHARDVAVHKARKADRKGKLAVGELATYIDGAWKDYKRAVDELARTLLDAGGVHEKADKGTDIHELCELYDTSGIDAVGELLTEGKITPSDLADVEAYARAIEAAGLRVLPDCIERPVVIDDLKVAGRLDRGYMVKLPGTQRAQRVVGDIKTGRVDYSAGKIAQQLELYSRGLGYDLNTHERVDLKLSKTKALLIHLPAGTATCSIYVVDLGTGRKGNALSAQVRTWRNEGKRAVDFTVDLATTERQDSEASN